MTDGMLSLSWNNHKATFCHILSTLREKERYTDVTVACEGKFYPVHKFVLSTCSEYFEKMFDNTPCKHPVIVLKDVLPDELEALLSYMYDGVVSVAQNDLARLIKAAELLRIKGLAVPDEPPKPEPNRRRTAQTRNASDDRTSPHPKRRRGDDSNAQRSAPPPPTASPPSSPRASPYHGDNEQASNRLQQDAHWMDQHDTQPDQDDKNDSHTTAQSSPSSKVQVVVDESLVKEEMVEPLDTSQDDGMDYGSLGSDSRLEGSVVGESEENASLMLPSKYEQGISPAQAQALPEAVVEALAGPSGMQGWLGGVEVPGGFSGMENYGNEGGQDMHQGGAGGAQQGHQMVEQGTSSPWAEGGRNTREWQGFTSKVHQCPHCAYKTIDSYNFKRHLLKHTGERPFACPHCSYSAARKELLKDHINLHTGEKPYTCTYCSYSASQRSSLNVHLRRHATEVGYRCPYCPFHTTIKASLKVHMQNHVSKDVL